MLCSHTCNNEHMSSRITITWLGAWYFKEYLVTPMKLLWLSLTFFLLFNWVSTITKRDYWIKFSKVICEVNVYNSIISLRITRLGLSRDNVEPTYCLQQISNWVSLRKWMSKSNDNVAEISSCLLINIS